MSRTASQRLDSGLEAELGLGLTQFGLTSTLARRVESVLLLAALAPVLVELGGQPAHLVALAAPLLDEVGVQHLDHVTVRCDALDEAVDRSDVTLDRHPAAFRCDPRLGVGSEAAFGFVEASFQQLLSLVQTGVVHLEVLATRCERGRPSFELGAQLSAGSGGIGLGLLVGFERRQQRLEFRDALLVAHDVGGDVVDRPFEVLQLGFGLPVLPLRLGQPLGRCTEASIVRVEATSQLGLGRAGRLESPFRRRDGFGRPFECSLCLSRPFEGIVEGRRGRSTSGGADAPAAEAEPVAGCRDHHRIGMTQRGVNRRTEVVDANRRPQQAIEQHIDARPRRPSVGTDRIADRGAWLAGGTGAQSDHGAAGVRTPQGIERAATSRRIVDDDRSQRLTKCRLDGRFPAGVDLDQIEQCAEHAVDAGKSFGAGSRPRGVERELERLHSRRAPRGLLRGVVSQRLSSLVGRDRFDQCGFGHFDLGDEWLLDRPGFVTLGP